jgi:hypothetical protein
VAGLSEAFAADGVAVPVSCTASGPAGDAMRLELLISVGSAEPVQATGRLIRPYDVSASLRFWLNPTLPRPLFSGGASKIGRG